MDPRRLAPSLVQRTKWTTLPEAARNESSPGSTASARGAKARELANKTVVIRRPHQRLGRTALASLPDVTLLTSIVTRPTLAYVGHRRASSSPPAFSGKTRPARGGLLLISGSGSTRRTVNLRVLTA
jgi:hypothetical protein